MKKYIITFKDNYNDEFWVKDCFIVDDDDYNKFKNNLYLLFNDRSEFYLHFGTNQYFIYDSLEDLSITLTYEEINYDEIKNFIKYFANMNIVLNLMDSIFELVE